MATAPVNADVDESEQKERELKVPSIPTLKGTVSKRLAIHKKINEEKMLEMNNISV